MRCSFAIIIKVYKHHADRMRGCHNIFGAVRTTGSVGGFLVEELVAIKLIIMLINKMTLADFAH